MKRTGGQAGFSERVKAANLKRRRTMLYRAPTAPIRYQPPRTPRPEKKWYDGAAITSTVNAAAGDVKPALVAGIITGNTDNTRVGGKIKVTNINVNGFAYNTDKIGGVYGGGNLRVILYRDKQCNGANALITDVLANANIQSFRNMDNLDRFDILKDKIFPVPCQSGTTTHSDIGYTAWKIAVKGVWEVSYSASTGAVADLRSTNFGIIYVTDTTTTYACGIGTCRIKYFDN